VLPIFQTTYVIMSIPSSKPVDDMYLEDREQPKLHRSDTFRRGMEYAVPPQDHTGYFQNTLQAWQGRIPA